MARAVNTREVGERVERLLTELGSVADAGVREKAEDLARLLVELYGAGLERIMEIVGEGSGGDETVRALAGDKFVGSLLVLHDLHPVPLLDRVQQALDGVRPYLGSHAGGIDFLGIDDMGVAHLALQGSCDGCPSSLVTVKLAVERAIMEAAPELTGLEVEGVVPEKPGPALHQIGGLTRRPESDWTTLDDLADLVPGTLRPTSVDGMPLVVCRTDVGYYAYRDRCPACGTALSAGSLTGVALACRDCARRYDVQRAGREVDPPAGEAGHLDPLPLVADERGVRVALPAGAAS
jgi:Fe-S cluster biogenesis protein NfuA/nitrite reductase/ring-hydroxylating ferredoxin subunit